MDQIKGVKTPPSKVKGLRNPKKAGFMGAGLPSNDPGYQPNYYGGMGDNYGTGIKNPQGTMRSDSIGYRPVSKKQLGTPPRGVV